MSRILLALVASFVVFGGCTKKEGSSKILNIAIWGNYLPEPTVRKFKEATGIQLNISNYASNEELLAKLQAGGAGYDVIVPSDYMVEILIKLNLLHPLEKSKIPNISNIEPQFLGKPYDEGNKFSLPYNYGVVGITYNKDLVKKDIKSWKDVFSNPDFKGKVSLLDDVRESMAVALRMNGSSVNTRDPQELEKAKKTLQENKKFIKMFRSDTIDPLVNKEIAIAHAYSSDALQATAKSGGKIAFVIAAEGGTSNIDNVAILSDAENIEAAHAFINFVLTPEANAEFVKTVYGTPVIKGVKEKLPENLQKLPTLFPSKDQMSKLESIKDLGEDAAVYDKIWTEVKTE